MRTTLDLNEKLIRELMDVTSAKTKTDAVKAEGKADVKAAPAK